MKNNLVTMKNSIIEAGYTLSINEARLVLAAISKIDNRESAEIIDPNTIFEIKSEEFAELFNLPEKYTYDELKNTVTSLFDRSITIYEEDKKVIFRWISMVKFDPMDHKVEIQWSQKLIPFISKLKEEFTSIKLEHITKLKSFYAIRIYKLLNKWKRVGRCEYSVEDLKKILDLGDSYKEFKSFNQKILTPSISSINKYTDLTVRILFIKTGRKVTSIRFTLGDKDERKT